MTRKTAKSARRRTKKRTSKEASKKSRKPSKRVTRKTPKSSGLKEPAARRRGTKRVPLTSGDATPPGQEVLMGPYKPGDPTKALRDYFKSNKKNQPPNYTRSPHTERTPRVRQVRHRRTGREGKYATLVLVREDYLDSRIGTPPVPTS